MASDDGLIYFVLDASRTSQRLKIGTTTNLKQRIDALRSQTMCAQQPLVLALEAGGLATEAKLHETFYKLRLSGEWFSYEGALKQYVAALDHPYSYVSDREELWYYARGWNGLPVTTKPDPVRGRLDRDPEREEDDPKRLEDEPALPEVDF